MTTTPNRYAITAPHDTTLCDSCVYAAQCYDHGMVDCCSAYRPGNGARHCRQQAIDNWERAPCGKQATRNGESRGGRAATMSIRGLRETTSNTSKSRRARPTARNTGLAVTPRRDEG